MIHVWHVREAIYTFFDILCHFSPQLIHSDSFHDKFSLSFHLFLKFFSSIVHTCSSSTSMDSLSSSSFDYVRFLYIEHREIS